MHGNLMLQKALVLSQKKCPKTPLASPKPGDHLSLGAAEEEGEQGADPQG